MQDDNALYRRPMQNFVVRFSTVECSYGVGSQIGNPDAPSRAKPFSPVQQSRPPSPPLFQTPTPDLKPTVY